MLEIVQVPVLTDNYIYLIHDPVSRDTATVDPAEARPVLDVLASKGWKLTCILNTHHHWDHVGGNLELQQQTGCCVIAPSADRHRIPGIDLGVSEGDTISLGNHTARVMYTPGHTLGHVVYHFADDRLLFCGDTLFVMGCGRLFEGTAEQMWDSLQRLKALPADTRIYCTHEYTQTNGRFALTVEPNNPTLIEKMRQVDELRARGLPTVPSTIGEELATNPFFREDSFSLQETIGLRNAAPVRVFAEIRRLKDRF
ncbi:hydroxyacylglutathione hydrolase [Candidatus Methylomicrobium oryzae]|jgi:hydroxyacylglutathione hydrolase|uniref:hydroxyacylglutathione hydrolase n=1 Tax=Candidatus Methylomicrobium oryzae TaxID=2802053 RepID=UPI001921E1B0|nr:hydroxyacylglutathione hydrolase [Methylomicrobium sp. RS1]MBL1264536.1 hydroxyacylglutathione hydrolase [Methylomicrobium sp. RS1]